MQKSYFAQFDDPAWSPAPRPPKPTDEAWCEQFSQATPSAKVNIANGWLHELNLLLKTQTTEGMVKGMLTHTLSKQYMLMRELLPLINPAMQEGMPFDGTMQNLVGKFVDIDSSSNAKYVEALQALWFGDNEERITGAALMTKTINGLIYHGCHADLIDNLVTKLAWDVVRKNRNNARLRKDAAFISATAGSTGKQRVDHMEVGNRIWYLMGKASKDYVTNFSRFEGMDLFQVMHREPLVVTATMIPAMMHVVREQTENAQPYQKRRGLVCAVDKTLSEVTDYDVLRAWIPSKNEFWDTAEALNVPYREACASVMKEARQVTPVDIEMPPDVAGEAQRLPM